MGHKKTGRRSAHPTPTAIVITAAEATAPTEPEVTATDKIENPLLSGRLKQTQPMRRGTRIQRSRPLFSHRRQGQSR